MRLYIKLAVMILLAAGVQRSLPSLIELSGEASFTLRCGVAEWSNDKLLQEHLLEEAKVMLHRRQLRSVAAAG